MAHTAIFRPLQPPSLQPPLPAPFRSPPQSVAKDVASKTEACRLWAEAAGFLQEAGETVRSADLRLRAAKAAEGFDNDLAIRMVDEVINMFDGDEDKDVYAVEPLRKALQTQLALGKHASAMRTMDRLFAVWTRLDQKHNLYKLVISRVILLLAAADPVAAQQEYDRHLDLAGFSSTAEAEAAEDLLTAYCECLTTGERSSAKIHTPWLHTRSPSQAPSTHMHSPSL